MKGMTIYSTESSGGRPKDRGIIPPYPGIIPSYPGIISGLHRKARNKLFFAFFFVFGVFFLRLLIEAFELLGSLFVYLFDELEDGFVLVFEEVLGLGQIAT